MIRRSPTLRVFLYVRPDTTRLPACLSHRTPKDNRLEELVTAASGTEIDWDHISEVLDNGRTGSQCCSRWQKVLHPQTIKGAWTAEVGVVVGVVRLVDKF